MAFQADRGDRPLEALVATLDHIVLSTPAPHVLADFYRRALGCRLERAGDNIVARAPGRSIVFVTGEPKKLAAAGYRVADALELARLRQRLVARGQEFIDGPTILFEDAVQLSDPDGNSFSFGISSSGSCAGGAADVPAARLQHVVLASRAPDRIVDFFVDVLGFTLSDEVVDDAGEVRTSFVRCSEEHHSFAVFKAPEDRLDHHCYETADWNAIRDWGDHMAKERIPIQWGPGRHGPGNNLFMFVHDPDGNWVELSAELEIVTYDRPAGQWPHEQRTLNSWGQGLLRS